MKSRFITVSALARDSTHSSRLVATLRLAGKWMEEAGFCQGDQVRVDVEYGRLVVQKVTKDGASLEQGHNPSEFVFVREVDSQTKGGLQ